MKSERRHELEHNQLADWLNKQIETVKPYQNLVLGGILLVVVLVGAYAWYTRQANARLATGWNDFYAAFSKRNPYPGDFADIAANYPNTHLGFWSHVVAGDLHLAQGCNQRFVSRVGGNQELQQALDNYTPVLQNIRGNDMLRERAMFGAARAYESLTDVDKALQHYENVVRIWPDGTYAAVAQRRIDALKLPSVDEMYKKFAQFDPKPAYSDEPGTPGEKPEFNLDSLPDESTLFQPQIDLNLEEKGERKDDDAAPAAPKTEPAPESAE